VPAIWCPDCPTLTTLSGGLQEDWDVSLYRTARFVIVSIAAFLYESAFNSANFLTALMRQQPFLFTPFHTGIVLAPGAMAMGLAGVGAGRLADIIDPRRPIFPGLLLQTAAMYYFALTSLEVSTLWFTFLVVLYHMSCGCVYTPLTSIVLKTLPHDRLSIVLGLDGSTLRTGGCLWNCAWQHDAGVSDHGPRDRSWRGA
jgi:MFS transporter, DHA2 family, lincomycin resistance protein